MLEKVSFGLVRFFAQLGGERSFETKWGLYELLAG